MSPDPQETPRRRESQVARVDEICDAFEAAWLAGDRPRIEAYLEEAEGPLRRELLRELVLAELDLRVRAGERPDRTEYVDRFPDIAEAINDFLGRRPRAHVSLGSTEPRKPGGTERTDQAPTPGGLQIRCPHCHTPVEVDADSPFTDITCNSCGSHFSLAGDETETRAAASVSTVGHFELVERLGLGGFGTVWKARDTELDRTVAVKIPRKGQIDPNEVEQFLREARTAAQLKHQKIYSGYSSDGGRLNAAGRERIALGWYTTSAAIVPEPGTITLLVIALLGVIGYG